MTSDLQIQANSDIRAMSEYAKAVQGPKLREKLRTLEVRKDATWNGTTILFVL